MQESFYILAEGEQEDGVEILDIDATTGTIIFNNHDTVQQISLADRSANPRR